MKLIYAMFVWMAGVGFQHTTDVDFPFGVVVVVSAFAFALVWMREVRWWRWLALGVLLFSLGAWRFSAVQGNTTDALVPLQNQGTVSVEGVVVREPDTRDTVTLLRVEVDRVLWLGTWRERSGAVQMLVGAEDEINFGDRIVATGVLRPAAVLDTFNYGDYLARRGINSVMSPRDVNVIGSGEGSQWRGLLLSIKQRAELNIERNLPEPQASLLTGILLGDDNDMPPEVEDAFIATGTSHIIAISGFNMALIAGLISSTLGNLLTRRWLVFWLSVTLILGYTVFVGAEPSVLRAAVMSSVLVLGQTIRQNTFVPASLAFVVLVMGMLDPWMLWDVGFQLSFAAVLGMMLLVEPMENFLQRTTQVAYGYRVGRWLRVTLSEAFVVSLAAQIFVLPLILHYFGRLSVLSLLANLLIVPVQAFVLVIGGMATMIGVLWEPPGRVVFPAVWLPLSWTTFIVRELAEAPWALLDLRISSAVLGMGVIVGLGMTFLAATDPYRYRAFLRQSGVWLAAGVVFIVALSLLATLWQRQVNQPDGRLHVTYLDAGLSNSVLIESPDGALFLIDGGPYPSRLLNAIGDRVPAHKRTIDTLFISHDDDEDIGAIHTLAERYTIQTVITAVRDSREQRYVDLLSDLETEGTVILNADEGHRIQTSDGVLLEILAPQRWEGVEGGLVVRLSYKDAVFLFTHELDTPQETQLLQDTYRIQATVLQVADHGRPGSNSQRWAATVGPQVAVLQNDPSHFQSEVVTQVIQNFGGAYLYRTDEHGHITISTNGTTLDIQTERFPD